MEYTSSGMTQLAILPERNACEHMKQIVSYMENSGSKRVILDGLRKPEAKDLKKLCYNKWPLTDFTIVGECVI